MATTKKTVQTRKSVAGRKTSSLKTTEQQMNSLPGGNVNNFLNDFSGKIANYKPSKRDYIILVVIGILLLAVYKKNLFVAATVNGSPLTNLELQMKLNQQFRSQTLNQLINEKVITDEANKSGATPSETEIDTKIAELETNVGGKTSLDTLLTQQGQTRDSLRDQIKIQLIITKLYSKEASVSADEVAKYIDANKDQMRATDSAGQEKEAYDGLQQQKLSQIFSQKFQELKQKANIKIF